MFDDVIGDGVKLKKSFDVVYENLIGFIDIAFGNWNACFDCLFVPSLSSCHEKAKVALYFGRIFTRLVVADNHVFRMIL